MIRVEPEDKAWLEHCRRHGWTRDSVMEDPLEERLKTKLLDIGGWSICLHYEEDLVKLLSERAKEYSSKRYKISMVRGEPSRCHSNVASLCKNCSVNIITGYGLTKDGMWRQHTWGLQNGQIIETTIRREVYFGFKLNEAEELEFVDNNYYW